MEEERGPLDFSHTRAPKVEEAPEQEEEPKPSKARKPKTKVSKKARDAEVSKLVDKLTGIEIEAMPAPPLPKGAKPRGGDRLLFRINPDDRTQIQQRWNRITEEWVPHSQYGDFSQAREGLTIMTTAEWRLERADSASGRKSK